MGDHTEAFEVEFDPDVVSYGELLAMVWSSHDPTRKSWSRQYMAAVFPRSDEQEQLATQTGQRAAAHRGGPLVTRIHRLERFYRAEDYHQKWRLRREASIAEAITARYPDEQAFIDSTTAARVNGYLGGHGKRRQLEAILPSFALPEDLAARILQRVP